MVDNRAKQSIASDFLMGASLRRDAMPPARTQSRVVVQFSV